MLVLTCLYNFASYMSILCITWNHSKCFKYKIGTHSILIFFIRSSLIRIFFTRIFFIRIFTIRIITRIINSNILRYFFFSLTIYLTFLKTLEDNGFYLFYKLNQSILLIDKKLRALFWYFITVKICIDFSLIRYYFSS